MFSIIHRFRYEIGAVLITGIAFLLVANLVKMDVLSWNWFDVNSNALGGLSSLCGAIAIAVGAVATYLRFFKGRTFATRAELELSVSVHPHGSNETLHAICLVVHNVGTLPMWNPEPLISVSVNGPDELASESQLSGWWTPHEDASKKETVAVIDTGEKSSFYAIHTISRQAWSVTYIASVKDDRANVWRTGLTVSNQAK